MSDLEVPPTTSASQLVSYAMCPRKYAAQYVYGIEPEFTSLALVLGSVVHSGVEWWFGERLEGRSPTIDDALGIVAADLVALTAEVNVRWKDTTPAELEAQARDLVRTYLHEHGEMPVAAVEVAFTADLEDPLDEGSHLPRPLKGYFDLVLTDNTVIEVKTISRAWPDSFLERHLQVGAYASAWNALHGGPSQVELHVIVKTKKPRIDAIKVERSEKNTTWWFAAARAIEEAILDGHFPPSPGPLCVECEYQRTCARWGDVTGETRRRRRPPLPVVPEQNAHLYAF
jgi:putative RecB family exonuclease